MELNSTLKLGDGGHLAYRDTGSGQPLVFVHGWGMGGDCFERQHRRLGSGMRVISFDLRGHGGSSPLPVGGGLATLGQDLGYLLDALELESAVLVGWSLGAMVCWETLTKSSDRVAGLVVIDMVPRLLNDASWELGLRKGRSAKVFAASTEKMRKDWNAYTRIFVPRIFAPGAQRPELIERACEVAAGNDPESMARLWVSMVEADFRPQLAHITTPALIVYGEQSQLYPPAAASALVAAMPNARKLAFAESGHSPHLEEPDLFNQTIQEFAQDLNARAPRAGVEAIKLGEKP